MEVRPQGDRIAYPFQCRQRLAPQRHGLPGGYQDRPEHSRRASRLSPPEFANDGLPRLQASRRKESKKLVRSRTVRMAGRNMTVPGAGRPVEVQSGLVEILTIEEFSDLGLEDSLPAGMEASMLGLNRPVRAEKVVSRVADDSVGLQDLGRREGDREGHLKQIGLLGWSTRQQGDHVQPTLLKLAVESREEGDLLVADAALIAEKKQENDPSLEVR